MIRTTNQIVIITANVILCYFFCPKNNNLIFHQIGKCIQILRAFSALLSGCHRKLRDLTTKHSDHRIFSIYIKIQQEKWQIYTMNLFLLCWKLLELFLTLNVEKSVVCTSRIIFLCGRGKSETLFLPRCKEWAP